MPNILQKRTSLAKTFLSDAEQLLKDKRFRSAVSRTYYAVYHACVVLFEIHGFKPSSFIGKSGRPATIWEHSIVTKHFFHEFVAKRQLFPWKAGQQLRRSYADRLLADYEPDAHFTEQYATSAFEVGQNLVAEIERLV